MQKVENLCRTLTVSDNSYVIRGVVVFQDPLGDVREFGRMNDFRVIVRERLWNIGSSTSCNHHMLRSPRLNLASLVVARDDIEYRDLTTGGFLWHHLDSLLVIRHHSFEPACAPPHVVFIFYPRWEEGIQVGKFNEPAFLV